MWHVWDLTESGAGLVCRQYVSLVVHKEEKEDELFLDSSWLKITHVTQRIPGAVLISDEPWKEEEEKVHDWKSGFRCNIFLLNIQWPTGQAPATTRLYFCNIM